MGKWLRRIALTLAALLALIIVGVIVYTRTESFRRLLEEQVVAAADGALRGDITLERIEGSIWSGLTVHDLRVSSDGEPVLLVPELRLRYSLGSLLLGRLEVDAIEIVRPVARLRQDESGSFPLIQALQPAQPAQPPEAPPEGEGGLPIDVVLSSLELEDGRVEVSLEGAAGRERFTVRDLHLDASGGLGSGGGPASLALGDLSARLTGEEIPPVHLVAQASLESAGDETSASIRALELRMPDSAIRLHGRVEDLADLRLDATLEVERLAAEEMQRLLAGLPEPSSAWPLAVDLAAQIDVTGSRDDLRGALTAAAGGARLRADARADLSAEEPVYRVELDLNQLAPGELLGREDVAGTVAAEAVVTGTGAAPSAVQAEVDLRADGLRVADAELGDLVTEIHFDEGEAAIVADLRGNGQAHVEGTLSLPDETYEVRLDVDALDLGHIGGAAAQAPEGELNLTAEIDGSGFALAEIAARAQVELERSRIGEVVVDRGRLETRIADSRATIEELTLRSSGANLDAEGVVGLTQEAPVRLDADLQVADLGPWLEMVGQSGSGSLSATAELRGTRSDLSADAEITARDVQAAGVELARADVSADLTGIGATPAGELRAELQGLEAGVEARHVSLRLDLEEGRPPRADVELVAEMAEGTQALRANVAYGEDLTVDLRELRLEAPAGTWSLVGSARILRDNRRIAVSGLRLESGQGGSVAVDGSLATTSGAAAGLRDDPLRIRIAELDLSPFQVFAGEAVEGLEGVVAADIRVDGSLEQLQPSGELRLREGRAEVVPLGVTIQSITLSTQLSPERIEIAELSARARDGRILLEGSVSLVERRPDTLDLHLEIERWPAIQTDRYQARVAARIDATGPIGGPDVTGRVEVIEARLRPPLSLPGSGGPPPRDASIVVVQEIEAEAEEEALVTEAAKETDLFRDTAIDVEIVIDRGTWVEKDESAIELVGQVSVEKERGETDVALIGTVRLERGWIYLYGRRFEPERGIITFTGGREIDPLLDFELRSRVSDYVVKTLVSGTVEAPKIEFESEPSLEDADVLALLVFGRPIHELGDGEQVALEQQVAGIAGNYVAGSLARAFGDPFGFRISELDVTKGLVGVGRYLTPDLYVSVQQSVTGDTARQAELEYYLTPSWTVKAQADTSGESGLDVFWRKNY